MAKEKKESQFTTMRFWSQDGSVCMNEEEFAEFKSRTVWPNGVDEMLIKIHYDRLMKKMANEQ